MAKYQLPVGELADALKDPNLLEAMKIEVLYKIANELAHLNHNFKMGVTIKR